MPKNRAFVCHKGVPHLAAKPREAFPDPLVEYSSHLAKTRSARPSLFQYDNLELKVPAAST